MFKIYTDPVEIFDPTMQQEGLNNFCHGKGSVVLLFLKKILTIGLEQVIMDEFFREQYNEIHFECRTLL